MDNYYIKRARPEDSELLSNLICELLIDFNKRSGSNFNIDKSKITTISSLLLERDNFAGFIAFNKLNNEAVGIITITQATAIYNGGDFGVITELYVDRELRSKGLGKLLVNAAIEFARSKNWKK